METVNVEPEMPPQKDSIGKSIGLSILKLIAYCGAVFVVCLALIIPLGLLFQEQNDALSEGNLDESNIGLLIGIWGLALLGTSLVTIGFCRFVEKRPISWAGFTLKGAGQHSLIGLAWGAGMVTLGFLVLLLGGWVKIEAVNFSATQLLAWALFFFLAAAFEEVLLRGYILNMFERHFNTKVALIVSSIIFGLLHLSNANVSFIGILNIILAGFVLGVAFLKSKDLWLPTILHFAWNYFQGTIYGFEVSGNKTYTLLEQQLVGQEWLTGGDFGFEGSILSVVVLLGFLWYYREQLVAN